MAERAWDSLTEADKAEFWACLALKYTSGIGPRTISRLLKYFGSAFSALEHKNDWPLAKVGLEKARLLASEAWRSLALQEWRDAQMCQASLLLWTHSTYPSSLRTLIDAPAFLYCRGDTSLLCVPSFAIVGSRQCSSEGVQVAADIARALSKAGISVVSGMAQGIDRVAHAAALEHLGKSIGVLGTGIDVVYPQQNYDIYQRLGQQGLLLTEFAPKTEPIASHFPIRNRLVSGLCLGVLVVEGALHSGSLITARLALEQNREVYAVPGAATAAISRGCQELIRQGAKPVFNSEDILYDLALLLQNFTQNAQASSALSSAMMQEQSTVLASTAHTTKHDQGENLTMVSPTPIWADLKNAAASLQENILPTQSAQLLEATAASHASSTSLSSVLTELSSEEQEQAQKILTVLHGKGECHLDLLCQELNLPVAQATILLTEMELAGMVKKIPGARYVALTA